MVHVGGFNGALQQLNKPPLAGWVSWVGGGQADKREQRAKVTLFWLGAGWWWKGVKGKGLGADVHAALMSITNTHHLPAVEQGWAALAGYGRWRTAHCEWWCGSNWVSDTEPEDYRRAAFCHLPSACCLL